MIKIRHKIFIRATPRKIWSVFSQLGNWRTISPMYMYAKHVCGEPWAVNSKFTFAIDYGIFKSSSVARITECMPGRKVTWVGTKPLIRGKHTFVFRKLSKGTEVLNYEEFTGIGIPIIPILNLKAKINKSFQLFLEGLKKMSE